jgi:hypothetical protein
MTDGLLTLITLRGQLASRIKNTEGRQPKRINAIPNRSPDLGIPSRTNALWPSFRPFCHPITAYRCSLHSRTEARAPVFRCLVYGNLDLIPIGNRKEHVYFITDPQTIAANVICLPNGTPRSIINAKPTIEGSAIAPAKSLSLPANPTVLPNDFLTTFLPVILIRHPAKIIPSYYRASRDAFGATVFDEDFPVDVSLRWSRLIFDWYEEYYCISEIEQRPIVIDAEDMINDSHYVAEKFCAMTGLDPKHVQYSWAEVTEVSNPIRERFTSTLRNSTGIIREDQVSISSVTLRYGL